MALKETALVDNQVRGERLRGEHGLSFLIEKDGKRLLFDTGQSGLFVENAEILGIGLEDVDILVLSHGHYDHTGGLSSLRSRNSGLRVYGHENAFKPKFRKKDEGGKNIGIPLSPDEIADFDLHVVSGIQEIIPGVHALTDIPRNEIDRTDETYFFMDEECTVPDLLEDDLSLVIETEEGLAVLLGCAHAGLSNILDETARRLPGRRVRVVAGGTHLISENCSLLELALQSLMKHNVKLFRPGHCTGEKALSYFMMQGFVKTDPLYTGAVITIEQ